MEEWTLNEAARKVVAARLGRQRLERLPGVASLADGYAVQRVANTLLERELGTRVGHKIGGTTAAMRSYINVPEPLAGEVFAHQLHEDGAVVARSDFVRVGIETEIAVRLGNDLPPRLAPYTREDAAQAVNACMASIELVDDRYQDFATIGGASQIADNVFDAGMVLGRAVADWRALDLAGLRAQTWCDGELLAEGRSDSLMGHPLDALAWIASKRSEFRLGLTAGSVVTLGSMTPVQWADEPGAYRIEVVGLGSVTVIVR